MNESERDPQLQAWFAEVAEVPAGDDFTARVMGQTRRLRRRRIVRRVSLGLGLALLAVPLQDVAVALTHVLVITLVDLDNALLATLLAPVNTVGSVLSAVLLLLRAGHRRLFR